jgi:hypothetical protein
MGRRSARARIRRFVRSAARPRVPRARDPPLSIARVGTRRRGCACSRSSPASASGPSERQFVDGLRVAVESELRQRLAAFFTAWRRERGPEIERYIADARHWAEPEAFVADVFLPRLEEALGVSADALPGEVGRIAASQRRETEIAVRDAIVRRDEAYLDAVRSWLDGEVRRAVDERLETGDFRGARSVLERSLEGFHGRDGRPRRADLRAELAQAIAQAERDAGRTLAERIRATERVAAQRVRTRAEDAASRAIERVATIDVEDAGRIDLQRLVAARSSLEDAVASLRRLPPAASFSPIADPWPDAVDAIERARLALDDATDQVELALANRRLAVAYAAFVEVGPERALATLGDDEEFGRVAASWMARHRRALAAAVAAEHRLAAGAENGAAARLAELAPRVRETLLADAELGVGARLLRAREQGFDRVGGLEGWPDEAVVDVSFVAEEVLPRIVRARRVAASVAEVGPIERARKLVADARSAMARGDLAAVREHLRRLREGGVPAEFEDDVAAADTWLAAADERAELLATIRRELPDGAVVIDRRPDVLAGDPHVEIRFDGDALAGSDVASRSWQRVVLPADLRPFATEHGVGARFDPASSQRGGDDWHVRLPLGFVAAESRASVRVLLEDDAQLVDPGLVVVEFGGVLAVVGILPDHRVLGCVTPVGAFDEGADTARDAFGRAFGQALVERVREGTGPRPLDSRLAIERDSEFGLRALPFVEHEIQLVVAPGERSPLVELRFDGEVIARGEVARSATRGDRLRVLVNRRTVLTAVGASGRPLSRGT